MNKNDSAEFPWNLSPGDEVCWNDPDEGACSKHVTIRTVEYHGQIGDEDCVIRLTGADGSDLECFAHELS